jgi:2-isopropylmalate synthase
MTFTRDNLLYQWNQISPVESPAGIEINDETLRDGLQASGIKFPPLQSKIKIVGLMAELGIDTACIGFPASNPVIYNNIDAIIREVKNSRLEIDIACAARTLAEDIVPIVKLSQKYGVAIDANLFIGSSPIRQFVEGWDIEYLLESVKKSIKFAVENNLPVCFITEDTTRSKPGDLRRIYQTAIASGAYRICLCDTVGYASPQGVRNLVKFIKALLQESAREEVLIDWHGHNDRGLALANALVAIESGVNRVHATALGMGERTGNTSMEQLLMNLKLMGLKNLEVSKLKCYCDEVARACQVSVPANFPMIGLNAFTTSSGIHAAAIIKAKGMNDDWLADHIYSSIPAKELGIEQRIEIGPLSGKSNIKYFLEKNGIQNPELLNVIWDEAKNSDATLTLQQLARILRKNGFNIDT